MTASEAAKALGFKSLTQVALLLGVTTQCLRCWHRDNNQRFMINLHGCLWLLGENNEK